MMKIIIISTASGGGGDSQRIRYNSETSLSRSEVLADPSCRTESSDEFVLYALTELSTRYDDFYGGAKYLRGYYNSAWNPWKRFIYIELGLSLSLRET